MQFTLRQLLLGVMIVAVGCASYVWAGIPAVVLFLWLTTLGLLILATVKRQRVYTLFAGGSLLLLSCISFTWGVELGTLFVLLVISFLGLLFAFVKRGALTTWLMATVCTILLLVFLFDVFLHGILGIGTRDVPLIISVVAADTGRPISQAKVRIREIESLEYRPIDPVPIGERGVEGLTDSHGQITLTYPYPCSVRPALFFDRSCVVLGTEHYVQVIAPGYETNFRSIAGGIVFIPVREFPISIEVRLHPLLSSP